MSRRLLAAALAALAVGGTAAPAGASGSDGFERRFERADASSGALFRWWWPGAAVEDAELVREIDAIADAGYKGVEIADVMDSVDYEVDPDQYGYGTERWKHAVKVALAAADRRGLQVDLTLGGRWPAAVPGLDVDGPSTSKELTYGVQIVRAGQSFSAPVPAPAPRAYEDRTSNGGVVTSEQKTSQPRYVTVSAVRCLEDCSSKPYRVDLDSQVDLSARVGADGSLSWTPPDSGNWVVVGYWYRGTGQRNDAPFGRTTSSITDPESRVIDHYSRAGTQAMIAYLETLLDPETKALLRRAGGAIFEDSLELTFSQAWTPEFQQRFREKRGYSLVPHLATIAHDPAPGPFAPSPRAFAFEGEDTAVAERVVRDVEQTLNDLYLEDHVDPLKHWVSSLGLSFRAQPYGEPIDLAQAAGRVDIPESESLACGLCDDWRALASGAEMAGRSILSDELLPGGFGGSYRVTYEQVVREANGQYSMGANQMVFHGFPYARWPVSANGAITDSAARWPGFHAFPAFIPEPFGPRQPEWALTARDYAAYYARTQWLLQAGRRRTDVAVYNQALDHLGASAYSDPGLLAAGYSYGYVTPGSLRLPSARVAGRRLAPQGPAFKALVLNNQESMPLASARKLLEFARSGLPIIVAGAVPTRTPGYAATAQAAAQQDAQLRDVVAALEAERSVRRVADAAAVPAALAGAGVAPDASSSAAAIRTIHRVDGGTDYYYVYNASADPVSGSVSLAGAGVLYELDAWTGETDRVAQYTTDAGRSRTTVALGASETKLFAIRRQRDDLHVISSTGGEPLEVDGDLVLRASEDGRYVTKLSNGRVDTDRVAGLPAPVALATWDLAVDEWRPPAPPASRRAPPATSAGASTTSPCARGRRSPRSPTRRGSAATPRASARRARGAPSTARTSTSGRSTAPTACASTVAPSVR